jgi:plasmid stability protein
MPNITVKDVPAKLHQRLKARALAHRRSLNREIVALLEAAAAPQKMDPDALLAHAASLRRRVAGRLTDSDLEELRNAGRP